MSISIDRHVRIHHTKTRRLLHRIYAKQRLTSMLLLNGNNTIGSGRGADDEDEDEEMDMKGAPDEMWDMLQERESGNGTSGTKRTRIQRDQNGNGDDSDDN